MKPKLNALNRFEIENLSLLTQMFTKDLDTKLKGLNLKESFSLTDEKYDPTCYSNKAAIKISLKLHKLRQQNVF